MKEIHDIYKKKCEASSDINEHLPILHKYAKECNHITEMGTREFVSGWAFLTAKPKKFVCYDIQRHPNIEAAEKIAKQNGIDFEFKNESTLTCEIEETDLLFIDTWHSHNQLSAELNRHAKKARKYIIMHDTTDCEFRNENWIEEEINGLYPAFFNFLCYQNNEWFIHEKFANNNGLTILKRKQ